MESLIALQHLAGGIYLNTGAVGAPHGNTHPTIAPYDLIETADRPIYLPGGNNGQWRKLTAAIGRPELADDPRFRNNQDRVQNRSAMTEILRQEFKKRTAAEWCEHLWSLGVPAGPVNRLNEVFAHEQVQAREMAISLDHPTLAEPLKLTGIPVKMHGTPGSIRRPPPLKSQHAREILAEHGYSSEQVEALNEAGAVVLM